MAPLLWYYIGEQSICWKIWNVTYYRILWCNKKDEKNYIVILIEMKTEQNYWNSVCISINFAMDLLFYLLYFIVPPCFKQFIFVYLKTYNFLYFLRVIYVIRLQFQSSYTLTSLLYYKRWAVLIYYSSLRFNIYSEHGLTSNKPKCKWEKVFTACLILLRHYI